MSFSLSDLKNLGLDELKKFSKDEALSHAGLQRQPSSSESVLPMIAVFGAGLLTGLCAGMLLAPSSGQETRQKLTNRAQELADDAEETSEELVQKGKKQLHMS